MLLKPGDKVMYIGWDNSRLNGKEGYVLPFSAEGRAYIPRDASHSVVPVEFPGYAKNYGAWYKNLRLVEDKEPNWEV